MIIDMKILPNIQDILNWKIKKFRWNTYNTTIHFWKTYSEELNVIIIPEYQRDDIWTIKQKEDLIRSLIYWVQIPPLILNKVDNTWRIIDWRQRFSTLIWFLQDKFKVDWLSFSDFTEIQRRNFLNSPLWYVETTFNKIEEEKKFYILFNTWGTPHTEKDFLKLNNN